MATSEKEGGGYSGQGLLAVLALLAGALVVHQFPLTTSRPEMTDRVAARARDIQDVDARLWQDPFAAADQHRTEAGKATARSCPDEDVPAHTGLHSRACFAELFRRQRESRGRIAVMPVMVFGGPY